MIQKSCKNLENHVDIAGSLLGKLIVMSNMLIETCRSDPGLNQACSRHLSSTLSFWHGIYRDYDKESDSKESLLIKEVRSSCLTRMSEFYWSSMIRHLKRGRSKAFDHVTRRSNIIRMQVGCNSIFGKLMCKYNYSPEQVLEVFIHDFTLRVRESFESNNSTTYYEFAFDLHEHLMKEIKCRRNQ